MQDEPDTTRYYVVANDEDQYSIWPEGREAPVGWRAIGEPRTKQECLSYISEVWLDMRPRSLRVAMQGGPESST